MALVDDCIKERWQTKKTRRLSLPLPAKGIDPKALMHQIFTRRGSENHNTQPSPLRFHTTVAAY